MVVVVVVVVIVNSVTRKFLIQTSFDDKALVMLILYNPVSQPCKA